MLVRPTFALTLLLALGPSFAQETTPPAPPENGALDSDGDGTIDSFFSTVTVTATGSERDTLEVATPVTVIPSSEIVRQAPESAVDLLRTQPGVDVNGVGPNQTRPVIRGQRGLRVLFLEDGLRLNNARRQTDFGEIGGLIDLDTVESVEVVRGAASVLYGSDAIGGVLNLIPSVPSVADGEALGGAFSLRYGSAAKNRRASAALNGVQGAFSFQVGASRRESDDYDAPKGRFGDVTLERSTTVLDTGIHDDSVWANFGYRINDDHQLRLRLTRYRAGESGFGFVPPKEIGDSGSTRIRITYPSQDFDRAVLSYSAANLKSALADRVETKLYWQSNQRQLKNDIDINIGPVGPGFPDSAVAIDTLNHTDLDTLGVRLEALKQLRGKDLLTYGIEGYRDDSTNTDRSLTTTTIRLPFPPFEDVSREKDTVANAPNATNSSWGLFVQDEIAVAKKLSLTAGLRYQKVTTKADATPGWDINGLDFNDSKVVGAATATWRLLPELNTFISYGRAFRAPNIIERLFNGQTPEGDGFQILNPQLQSEDSKSWDVGLKYRRRSALMELTLFRTDIDGGIVQNFLSAAEIAALPADLQDQIEASGARFVVQQVNADRLRYQGVELSLGYRTPFGMTFGGNYTHLSADRIDSTNPPTGDTYADKLVGYARWEPASQRYWIEYRLRHNSSADASFDPDQGPPLVGKTLPAFTVHTLAGGVMLAQMGETKHELSLAIENLTDELYAEFSNASFFRPEPGRNVRGSYRLRF